ncbi:GerAB/ArcD/ProY family transporter [Tumebacillus sp. DT12]|uniref:GerAB/ArcD/ProY family transporter n=1 Tax=Tumebacillus lacus TaxID=2995335 RepID=A0ABT3WYM8_9BACL|nr:GerAB/ArcD/ProY family transporter [Tumebacillus lacus]MCX7568390.1 GerAB/ArcD/ProY family transporter [Tumebacillus lacus]
MLKTGYLGRRELFALVFAVLLANVFLTLPQQMVMHGGAAAWMIPFVSAMICMIVWAVCAPALVMHPGENMLSLAERCLGRIGAGIAVLMICLFLMAEAASTFRLFTEMVITTVLPRSPISFIAIPFLLSVLYYAYTGIEGLTRVSSLFLLLFLFGLVSLLALNSNWMNVEYLFPFWGTGPLRVISGGWQFSGAFLNVLLLAVFGSLLRNPADAVRIGYWSTGATAVVYAVMVLSFTLIFPPEASMRAPFPLYQLGRLIYIGQFIQRLEAAFVFIWVALALIKVGTLVFVISYLIAWFCRMPVYRPVVFSVGTILYALAFVPESWPEVNMWNTNILMKVGWTVAWFIPMAILWMARWKDGKGEDRDAHRNAS